MVISSRNIRILSAVQGILFLCTARLFTEFCFDILVDYLGLVSGVSACVFIAFFFWTIAMWHFLGVILGRNMWVY